jgi:hypothetical protein
VLVSFIKQLPYVVSRHHSMFVAASNSEGRSTIHATEPKARSVACKKVYKNRTKAVEITYDNDEVPVYSSIRSHLRTLIYNKLTISHHGIAYTTWRI